MEFLYYNKLDNDALLSQVWNLLCQYDHEFIPPLSARGNTFQKDLNLQEENNGQPFGYFSNLKNQAFIVALTKEQRLAGFMSFRNGYTTEELKKSLGDRLSCYVTTIIVDEEYRGRGITATFYDYLENKLPKEVRPNAISTRTWSSNLAHIAVLMRCGFRELNRIKNDRGEGVDTVYYGKVIY